MTTREHHLPKPSRRALAAGVAWSLPVIAGAHAAPVLAASPSTCKETTMSWGAARAPKIPNPMTLTIDGGSKTIYARVSYVNDATMIDTTGNYHLGVGKNAYGTNIGQYTLATTGGANDLILNQRSDGGSTQVTIDFFSDAALTQPEYVVGLQVPLDDFSSATGWEQVWLSWELVSWRSYEEGWSVTGVGLTGATVTAALAGISSPYNTASTLANISGSGTPSSPWYFSAEALTNHSREQVGGNVLTKFTQQVKSVTITYSGNPSSWAQCNRLFGAQGAGIGRFVLCV